METPSTTPDAAAADDVPAAKNRGGLYVLQSGLLTTALALAGVYLLSSGRAFGDEFNVMGFYVNYVLPVGAVAIGLVAGIGYGWAAWYTGFKLRRPMLGAILVIQIVAYFVAQYIEFRGYDFVYEATGEPVGFWEYFHATTMAWAWEQDDGSMGDALGAWGYAFRGLEILGFALGALILPGFQMSRPYCDACRRYKKTRQLGLIRASVPLRKIPKDDAAAQAAYEAEQQKMLDEATQTLNRLKELATAGDAEAFGAELAALKASEKEASKLPVRIRLDMEHCPGCLNGILSGSMLIGQGENVRVERIAGIPVGPQFVSAL